MNIRTLGDLLFASALALLLVSCGSTHHVTAPSAGELADFVLWRHCPRFTPPQGLRPGANRLRQGLHEAQASVP